MMIKLSKKLIAEVVSWETEWDREQGESWIEEKEIVENSEDIQILLDRVDELSEYNQAVEMHVYTEDEEKWIGMVYHVSVDGVENINRIEEPLDCEEITKIINERISC